MAIQDGTDEVRVGPDQHPAWAAPFWIVLAMAAMFLLGCVFGATLMGFSMLGPLGPGDGPRPGAE